MLQARFRGRRERAQANDLKEYDELVDQLRAWRAKVNAVVAVQKWMRGLKPQQLLRQQKEAAVTLQARVRGKGGRATAAAARTAAQEAEAAREAERERAKESKRKAVNDRLRAQKEHMEWLSTSNRSRRASLKPSGSLTAPR